MNIEKYGYQPTNIHRNIPGTPARITAVHREHFEFACEAGNGIAYLKASEYRAGNELFPTTGDFVMLDWQNNGPSRIVKTLPRKTYFSRLDPSSSGHAEQAVAANFDYVFIMQSLDRDFNLRRLERYLTLAWQSGATPAVILTKADTVDNFSMQLHAVQNLAIGVDVFAVSVTDGIGLVQLSDYLRPGKTIVFLGSSGVGKSSLVNTLAGSQVMATKDTRKKDGRGRHATTHRQLIMLPNGGMVIDTPGMRELGMWDVTEGLGQSFADVEQYFDHCKFSDCSHRSEPGCAIKGAIRSGKLSAQRWESYLHLGTEARFTDDKAEYLRGKAKWFKEIALMKKKGVETDYRREACTDSFSCTVCGAPIAPTDSGSSHRNHCPHCLSSLHVDNRPGDRAALCKGTMDPIGVWVRDNGEWALIHRCRSCGVLSSNRIAADDNEEMLMSIANKPLKSPPFPKWQVTTRR